MAGKDDGIQNEPPAESRQRQPVRKPWRAPEFIETDIVSTDTMCQAGLDGPGLS